MKQTIEPYGRTWLITLEGNPTEVEMRANRLFNFGVVSTPPEDFEAGKDKRVVLSTYREKMASGLLAMAVSQLSADEKVRANFTLRNAGKRNRKFRGVGFMNDARALAETFGGEFQKVESFYTPPSKRGATYREDGDPCEVPFTHGISE